MPSCCVASTWHLRSPSNESARAGEESVEARTRARARDLAGSGPTGKMATAGWNRLDCCSSADDGALTEESMMPFGPDVSLSAGPRAEEFVLRPITAADARLDCEAVMASREYLRQRDQSTWREEAVAVGVQRSDLAGMRVTVRRQSEGPRRPRMMELREPRIHLYDPRPERIPMPRLRVHPSPDATFLSRSEINPTAEGAGEWSDIDAAVCHWVRR